jgi:hypothetical protein
MPYDAAFLQQLVGVGEFDAIGRIRWTLLAMKDDAMTVSRE